MDGACSTNWRSRQRSLGRSDVRSEDNSNNGSQRARVRCMDWIGLDWIGSDWIGVQHGMDWCRALVITVRTFGFRRTLTSSCVALNWVSTAQSCYLSHIL
jgi:hypothetical protein